MKSILFVLTITMMLSIVSCDGFLSIVSDNKDITGNPIDIDNPKVGQYHKFRLLQIENFYSIEPSCYDLPDTMIAEVIAFDDTSITFAEYLTEGSASYDDTGWISVNGVIDPGETYYFKMVFEGGYFSIKDDSGSYPDSRLFHHYSDDLPRLVEGQTLQWNDCMLSFTSTSVYEGRMPGFTLNGQSFEHVIGYIDYEMMAVDGPGVAFIYNMVRGLIKSYSLNPWTSTGIGWELTH